MTNKRVDKVTQVDLSACLELHKMLTNPCQSLYNHANDIVNLKKTTKKHRTVTVLSR